MSSPRHTGAKPPDSSAPGLGPHPSAFEDLPQILVDVATKSQDMIREFSERNAIDPGWQETAEEELDLTTVIGVPEIFAELTKRFLSDPQSLARAQAAFWENSLKILTYFNQRLTGAHPQPIAEPKPGDRRFADPDWSQDPYFDTLKQQYLLFYQWLEDMVLDTEGLSAQERKKALFFTRRAVDAMAPTNFLFTNPEALHETIETRGENLVRGIQLALEDMERSHGRLAPRASPSGAFEVGRNLATTPGKVIFQNEMMELIQYTPSTESVRKTPLLIVPPWINKYYILDLTEDKSFIKWAVDQGHTVFVISWANPDQRHADAAFSDYMNKGPLAALDVIEQATGESQVNAAGYCIGGTLLACTLAYLAQTQKGKKKDRIKSATFITTLLDFGDVGELSVFIDEGLVSRLEHHMKDNGILHGREMASTFSLLRANDLVWQFAINSYLLGREPKPFDILYWNADCTNMPAAMHAYYLRSMYLENRLKEPGGVEMTGPDGKMVGIDLSTIKAPCYFLATRDDHIAPWASVLASTKLVQGPVKFTLAGSGHVAGVINPPKRKKYGYWTNTEKTTDPHDWRESATQHPGSWWPDWGKWATRHAGPKAVAPRKPGGKTLRPIGDAPGEYVKKRAE